MHLAAGILLLVLLEMPGSCSQKPAKRPKQPESPFEKIQVKDNFNSNQFAGKWFLIGVASECEYLKENNHRVEATILVVSPVVTEKKALPISTFRKLDGICWEIKNGYEVTKVPGRFLLKARGYKKNVDMVVGETDYSTYAILYYQKNKKITVKLYGRNINIADSIFQKFEQRVTELGIPEDFIYTFPKYGFCDSADKFHILSA